MKRTFLLLTALMFVLSSALPAQTVIRPFNGTNLDGWQTRNNQPSSWVVGRLNATPTTFELAPAGGQGAGRQGGQGGANFPAGATQQRGGGMQNVMINNSGGGRPAVDILTEQMFGDMTLTLEFSIARGSNSGVYLMGEYEIQILDTFALEEPRRELRSGDMGGIYGVAVPQRNAAGVPGTWQTLEIEFVAPRFSAAGEKTSNAIVRRAVLNGVLIHENVEIPAPTGGALRNREAATGPLLFQGTHGRVAFRNIVITIP